MRIEPYGPGTVEVVRDGLVGVVADVGQIWFRRPEDVHDLEEEGGTSSGDRPDEQGLL